MMKDNLYKAGLFLAVAPLVVGGAILALLLTTRSEAFVMFAYYAFIPCVVSVLIAFGCLIGFFLAEKTGMRKRAVPALKLLGLILLAPAIVFGVFTARVQVETQYVLIVENTGKSPVTDVAIKTTEFTDRIRTIAPGREVRRFYNFSRYGGYRGFTANVGGRKISGNLEGCSSRARLEFPEHGPFKFTSILTAD